ncbi:MAG: GNAT family N-acetyltransferase [candidate division Zixibacteria bacterium]|nr:GNAT family N-acetyltransferase [candidate division Zixibacteria bacterium]
MTFQICPVTDTERPWVLQVARGWGADFIVTRGRKVCPNEIDGYYATDPFGRKLGLVTFEIIGNQCEVVTLDAFEKYSGIGTALIERASRDAGEKGCRRVWLITTNDNLDAIRFYQRRGFTLAAVHVKAIEESRRLKPSIPEVGLHGIPLRDEIEFEMML